MADSRAFGITLPLGESSCKLGEGDRGNTRVRALSGGTESPLVPERPTSPWLRWGRWQLCTFGKAASHNTPGTPIKHAAVLTLLAAAFVTPSTNCSAAVIEGFTQPYQTVEIAAPETGIIASVNVSEGDVVKSGSEIAALDCSVLQAALESARAKAEARGRLRAAEAQLRMKASRRDRLRALNEKGHASAEELDRAEIEAEIAGANVSSVKEELRAAALEARRIETQVDRRVVRSPFDGIVTFVAKAKGELVNVADAHVATLVQLDRLRVTFYLPTMAIYDLWAGHQVTIRFPAGAEAVGDVEFVSPVTDADSGTVRTEVILLNNDGQLRSGVRCEIDTDRLQGSSSNDP